jgi:site-specific DNA recombinase
MASDAAGARLTFGALALVNDTFLQLVRTETHRGLEGRARAGYWAGGSCYGFRTIPEPNPQDPERPRASIVIDQEQSEVVRRIFRDYAAGTSLGDLINALNREGVAAPADGRGYKAIAGWSKSLLFFVLRNERYIGQFVWNKRQWFRDPITKRRRYRERPESEWIRTEQPDLVIVDRETWERVQARHEENARQSGAPGRTGYKDHMLSGLLRCGTCGSSLTIVSRSGKDGHRWSNYGCSARHAKGETACSNRKTVSELRVNRAVLGALVEFVRSPNFTTWVQDAMQAAEAAQTKTEDGTFRKLQTAVQAQEARVEKVASTLLQVGASDFLKAKLRQEEEKLREARQALAVAATPKRTARALPKITIEEVLAVLEDVERIAREAPRQARDVLATVIEPVILNPTPDGYEAEIRLKSRTATLASGRPVFDAMSCGGRI